MKKKKSKSSASAPASTNSITSPPRVVNRLSSMKVLSSRKSPASVLHAASPRSSSQKVSSNRKSPASVLCAASPRSPSKKVSSSRKSPASLLPGASPKRSHDSPQSNDRRHKAKKIGTNTAANLSKKASRHTASRHTAALASPTSTVTTESSSPSSTISSPATPRSNASDRRRARKLRPWSTNYQSMTVLSRRGRAPSNQNPLPIWSFHLMNRVSLFIILTWWILHIACSLFERISPPLHRVSKLSSSEWNLGSVSKRLWTHLMMLVGSGLSGRGFLLR